MLVVFELWDLQDSCFIGSHGISSVFWWDDHFLDVARCLTTWWRHQIETFSALLAICAGNSPVPVNSPLKGQWRRAMMFPLISAWINGWVSNREAGDLKRNRTHYDVILIIHSFKPVMNQFTETCITRLWTRPEHGWKQDHVRWDFPTVIRINITWMSFLGCSWKPVVVTVLWSA